MTIEVLVRGRHLLGGVHWVAAGGPFQPLGLSQQPGRRFFDIQCQVDLGDPPSRRVGLVPRVAAVRVVGTVHVDGTAGVHTAASPQGVVQGRRPLGQLASLLDDAGDLLIDIERHIARPIAIAQPIAIGRRPVTDLTVSAIARGILVAAARIDQRIDMARRTAVLGNPLGLTGRSLPEAQRHERQEGSGNRGALALPASPHAAVEPRSHFGRQVLRRSAFQQRSAVERPNLVVRGTRPVEFRPARLAIGLGQQCFE